jgi:aspartate kinase
MARHMPSGIDNISIIMRSNQIKDKENEVLSAIRKKCDIDELSIDHDLIPNIIEISEAP